MSEPLHLGYARISTDDQKLDLQRDAMRKAGIDEERLYTDQMSGSKASRPGLDAVLKALRPGDTLVVWRLDRLGRDMMELTRLVKQIEDMGCNLKSLTESIDTTSAVGKFIFHMFAAMAEFERNLIRERTIAGLKSARDRGRRGGRRMSMTDAKRKAIKMLLIDTDLSVDDIAKKFGHTQKWIYDHFPGGRQNPEIAEGRAAKGLT